MAVSRENCLTRTPAMSSREGVAVQACAGALQRLAPGPPCVGYHNRACTPEISIMPAGSSAAGWHLQCHNTWSTHQLCLVPQVSVCSATTPTAALVPCPQFNPAHCRPLKPHLLQLGLLNSPVLLKNTLELLSFHASHRSLGQHLYRWVHWVLAPGCGALGCGIPTDYGVSTGITTSVWARGAGAQVASQCCYLAVHTKGPCSMADACKRHKHLEYNATAHQQEPPGAFQ